MGKQTFALFFGNRGFFPESLIAGARKELQGTLAEMGYATLTLGDDATRYGAVETAEEGLKYAAFLAEHRGEYDGVILSLPNFGDENGAVAALIPPSVRSGSASACRLFWVVLWRHILPQDMQRIAQRVWQGI